MQKKVLITGGTGLVGKVLSKKLLDKGYQVSFLSRSQKEIPNIKVYQWNIEQGAIEEEAVLEADYIVHLAGAGVADKNWTEKRKKLIIESRTKSADLIQQVLENNEHKPQAFISASGISIYGDDKGEIVLDENSPSESSFLAEVVKVWEKSADQFSDLEMRVVKLRIGIVLSPEGGALPKIVKPIRYGFGASLGSGRQYVSWIHVDDLAEMFIQAIENQNMIGVYNAVAPNPVSNQELTKKSAKVLKKGMFLPNVPSFMLKLMMGEMANIVLGGLNISGQKILDTGFQFQYTEIEKALEDLLN